MVLIHAVHCTILVQEGEESLSFPAVMAASAFSDHTDSATTGSLCESCLTFQSNDRMIRHRMKNPDSVLPLTHLSESLLCENIPCPVLPSSTVPIRFLCLPVSRHQIAILPQAMKLLN